MTSACCSGSFGMESQVSRAGIFQVIQWCWIFKLAWILRKYEKSICHLHRVWILYFGFNTLNLYLHLTFEAFNLILLFNPGIRHSTMSSVHLSTIISCWQQASLRHRKFDEIQIEIWIESFRREIQKGNILPVAMLRSICMSDYRYRYVPREKLIADPRGDNYNQPKIKREFQFHENGDTFFQDMEWEDLNLTVYQLDHCRYKPRMRIYPDGKEIVNNYLFQNIWKNAHCFSCRRIRSQSELFWDENKLRMQYKKKK